MVMVSVGAPRTYPTVRAILSRARVRTPGVSADLHALNTKAPAKACQPAGAILTLPMYPTTKPPPPTSKECGGQWLDIGVSRFRVSAKAKRKKKRHAAYSLSKLKTSQPETLKLDGTPFVPAPLSENFRKRNFLLGQTIEGMFARSPVERYLFVTLTFAEEVRSTEKANLRLRSLLNQIRFRHGQYLWVLQPHKSGRIHYHLLVPVDFWTHDGVDLDPWRKRNSYDDSDRLAAMSPKLRAESDWWSKMAPKYGFGRVEVAPIYGDATGIVKYLQRHEWRHQHWPFVETKGFQFWNSSRALKAGTMKFAWHSKGATRYRCELKEYAQALGAERLEDLALILGSNWSFYFKLHREFTQVS